MRYSKRIIQMDTEVVRQLLSLAARQDVVSFAGGPSAGFLPLREKLAQRVFRDALKEASAD